MTEQSRARFRAEARADNPDPVLLCVLAAAEHTLAEPPADGSEPPTLDELVAACQAALDRHAAAVRLAVRERAPGGADEVAALLAAVLGGRERFHGRPSDYRRLESSLLPDVLRRRRGLPIMLALVWQTVARRAGLTVHGVALPGHFIVAVGDPAGGAEYVLADPYHGGRLLDLPDVTRLATAAGHHFSPEMLAPAQPLDVVLRVLGNIRSWAADRPEHARAQLWATELSLLLPRHPAQLRLERAQLLVRTGDFIAGAAEMEAYAEILDAFDPDGATRTRHEARAARHRLN
ncbi:regulator of sirC expression with transglutaminase-like and TPR domain [Kitasatospora gansuensis]|uniref:Regulator of sirC expression with transglutaminase-like and TPR domain n=1 Tax=Kitasatospora gansuensis TaxID=258050 RepID=A0A7W7WHV6_9ACTN|nr:transglutaminase-like domain-containing protein [Kitasatospora gansuensis]MBB4947130.1 regulator of sirC expression with transglutaminase-like and TPR domain [Kitasatospora gansuensis]